MARTSLFLRVDLRPDATERDVENAAQALSAEVAAALEAHRNKACLAGAHLSLVHAERLASA